MAIRQCVRDLTGYLVFITSIVTIGPLLFGFHLAELNAPQDVITCKRGSLSLTGSPSSVFPPCIPMDDAQFAIVTSIFTLGGLLGALSAGPISTNNGRLRTMRLSTLFYIIGSIFEVTSINIPTIAIGRLVAGIGAGASLVVVPIYIAETAPPEQRGLFGVLTQITINMGLLFTQVLGYYLSNREQWRYILVIGGGLAVLYFIGLLFIPETPAWLTANRDSQDAIKVLQRIRGTGSDIQDEIKAWGRSSRLDEAETAGLLGDSDDAPGEALPASNDHAHIGILAAASDSKYRPAIIAVVLAMFAQQFCGINSVMMYSVSLFSTLFPTSSTLLTIAISVVNLFATIACAPLPDKLGRKTSLLISISGMAISSLALAFAQLFAIKILSAISVLLFVASFGVGLGPIPFILASELVGQEARGATQSLGLGSQWLFTFIVAQFFPILNRALGGNGWVYFIFAAVDVLTAVGVWLLIPETKGKKSADEVWGRTERREE